eukprot:GHRR01005888.1.p3 GENE.GHRR01005888.1~~GHRR01005888.1.p3  ORF type:complete len:102 (+),score=37.75 GHRR01005888.1:349-654(+)
MPSMHAPGLLSRHREEAEKGSQDTRLNFKLAECKLMRAKGSVIGGASHKTEQETAQQLPSGRPTGQPVGSPLASRRSMALGRKSFLVRTQQQQQQLCSNSW